MLLDVLVVVSVGFLLFSVGCMSVGFVVGLFVVVVVFVRCGL